MLLYCPMGTVVLNIRLEIWLSYDYKHTCKCDESLNLNQTIGEKQSRELTQLNIYQTKSVWVNTLVMGSNNSSPIFVGAQNAFQILFLGDRKH